MGPIDRRTFVRNTTVSAAALAAGMSWAADTAPAAKKTSPQDKVTLGNTGVQVTRLGIGTGTKGSFKDGSAQTRLGEADFIKLVRHAYDAGIRFFDLADLYTSHYYFRKALKEIPRDEITIQSKIWWRLEGEHVPATLRRFQRELNIDCVDLVLLHCVTEGTWPEDLERQMDALEVAKENGMIRAHGVSCHGYDPLKRISEQSWVDSSLLRINPVQSHMDDTPENVCVELDKIHKAGKGVIGMKIYGEGDIKSPEDRDKSLKFVLGLDSVDAFIIGFETPEQIDDTVENINRILKA